MCVRVQIINLPVELVERLVEPFQTDLAYNDRELYQVSRHQDNKDGLATPSDQVWDKLME